MDLPLNNTVRCFISQQRTPLIDNFLEESSESLGQWEGAGDVCVCHTSPASYFVPHSELVVGADVPTNMFIQF